MDISQEIYTALWNQLPADVIDKIKSGMFKVNDYGMVVDKATNRIVKHLQFDSLTQNPEQLMELAKNVQGLQTAMAGMVAISTVAIMGTVIACTAYLANQIEKLQESISELQKEIHDQNVIFYVEKIANYFGAVEALREVCASEEVVEENHDLILNHLANLAVMRNQIFYFIDAVVKLSDSFSQDSKLLAIDFVNRSLDMLPKAIYLESQSAYKIGRIALATESRNQSYIKYNRLRESYRQWCNDKVRQIHEGKVSAGEAVLLHKKDEIKMIIDSEENRQLLDFAA
ncbi:hypothetical protein [Desulfuromonas acetoxidans]|uniref:hypothetical protein n=1 Tax=Desulfuromonas acetoxidans TaxID=891 RepID=UPI00292F21ED|nr:hypothetical protein [Desulfuromonas acetoxidans]